MRESAAHAGRDPDGIALHLNLPVEVTETDVEQEPDRLRGSPRQIAEAVARFDEVGVQHLALQFLVGRYPERLAQMERLMPALLG